MTVSEIRVEIARLKSQSMNTHGKWERIAQLERQAVALTLSAALNARRALRG